MLVLVLRFCMEVNILNVSVSVVYIVLVLRFCAYSDGGVYS